VSNFLIQSIGFSTAGNFEAVVPGGGGLVHLWRNNDDTPTLPWSTDGPYLTNLQDIGGVALIQSNAATPGATPGYPGNLEIIVVANGELFHFTRNSATLIESGTSIWSPDLHNPIASGVSGWPAMIQSSFGTVGNFEVVVPSSNSGLQHFWRNNDTTDATGTPPWIGPKVFGQEIDGLTVQWQGASLIQSSFGNLEVVAVPVLTTGTISASHFWQDGASNTWTNTASFGGDSSITGSPSLYQSNFGSPGNFEVVLPFNFVQAFTHWWRNNGAANFPWATTGSFARPGGPGEGWPGSYNSMGLIQSSIDNSLVAAAFPSAVAGGGVDIYIRTAAAFEFSTTVAL
jgi:hypothetical protein